MAQHRISVLKVFGLKPYLDETAEDHNGNTYADFAELMEKQSRPTDAEVAAEFGVSPMTIGNWRRVYADEKEKPRPSL